MSTSTPHSQAVAQVQCVHREVRWAPFVAPYQAIDSCTDTWRCVDCCMEFGPVEVQPRTLRDAVNCARSEAEAGQLTLCADHAHGWDSDGTCPLCEAQQAAANFAVSEAENERLRGRIAELKNEIRCCLNQAHTDTLHGLLPAGEGQFPCACDEPVAARPVQCLRHQIVRVRP